MVVEWLASQVQARVAAVDSLFQWLVGTADDVKQFLLFIEYRLHVCGSVDDALEILPDVDTALSLLDQAMAQIPTEVRRAALADITRPALRAPKPRAAGLGRS